MLFTNQNIKEKSIVMDIYKSYVFAWGIGGKFYPHILSLIFFLSGTFLCTSQTDADLIIANAKIITGNEKVIENGSVVIKGNKIKTVTDEKIDSKGVTVIDAKGKTLLPGLIDTHIHITMKELFMQPRSDSAFYAIAENEIPVRLKAFVEAGITTVLSMGDYWPFSGEIREKIRTGQLTGPRLYTAGPLFTATGGHPSASFCGFLDMNGINPWCIEYFTREIDNPEEARRAVEKLKHEGEI